MSIGIPYGPAVVDDHGYGVQCPECGQVFRGRLLSHETDEDQSTKGASYAYALHYERDHA